MRISTKGLLLLFAICTNLFSQTPSPAEGHDQQIIPEILRQTKTIQVSCGDYVDTQTCKFFVNALNVALESKHVQAIAVVFYDDPGEEMFPGVRSFYVPPRLLPSSYVTLKLIEDGPPQATRLMLGGACFDPKRLDYYASTSLPRWSEAEGGRDTGPSESDKAAAASKIAKAFAGYWTDTVKDNNHKGETRPQNKKSPSPPKR